MKIVVKFARVSQHELNIERFRPRSGRWVATRVAEQPLIHKKLHPSIGVNIQGPSVIAVPSWISRPLGKYYCYFADHKGSYIRLAYADEITGPWSIYAPGALHLADSCFPTQDQIKPPKLPSASRTRNKLEELLPHDIEKERSTAHIASPDVHVLKTHRVIVMFYHGLTAYGRQDTRAAISTDGIHFRARERILSPSYLRMIRFQSRVFGMTMPGDCYWSKDLLSPLVKAQRLFNSNFRHHALLLHDKILFVFWTEVQEAPEHIKVSWIDLSKANQGLNVRDIGAVLKPEREWEGALEPNRPSQRSVAYGLVNQLRDPSILVDENEVYLFYAGGGESAIGAATLKWESRN